MNRLVWLASIVVGVSFAVPAPAQPVAETQELQVDPALEAAAAADAPAADDADAATPSGRPPQMNPDISLILDTAAAAFSRGDHLHQGGHAVDESGMVLQGLEFVASANVDPYFRFDLNFQLAGVHLEEAALTTLALPGGLQARAGYLMVPFGRGNTQHLHTWSFVSPSLLHTRFLSAEHFSGVGAELSALLPLPFYLTLTANVLDPHRSTGLRSASFGAIESSASGRVDGLEDPVYSTRIHGFYPLSDDWSLSLGASGAFGQSPFVPDNRAALWGGDLYLKWRPVSSGDDAWGVALSSEYVLRDVQVPGDSVREHGLNAQVDAWLGRFWMVSVRGEGLDHVSGTVHDQAMFGTWQRRSSIALTWLPTHFSKLRLQGDWGQGEGNRPAFGVFVQAEVSAGEHGAHAF